MSSTTILIVEDELVVALDLQNCLEHAGYTIVGKAVRGEEAVERRRGCNQIWY